MAAGFAFHGATCIVQVGISFLSRIVGNTFSEFMPDLLNRKRNSQRKFQGP
jgi:hypothetical protein